MRYISRHLAFMLALAAGIGAWPAPADVQIGEQNSLSLYFSVMPDAKPGLYDYSFKLVLDNNTGTWSALTSQGYGGIVFGDVPNANSSLADFALSSEISSIGVWSASLRPATTNWETATITGRHRAGLRHQLQSHHLVSHRNRGFAELVRDQRERSQRADLQHAVHRRRSRRGQFSAGHPDT